jgi:putative tricarboxylic transport membrane protein
MTRLNREHLLGLSCLVVSGVTLTLSAQLPKGQSAAGVSGPALFPVILALVLLGSGIAEIVIGFAKSAAYPALSPASAWKQLKRPEVVNVFLIITFWILYELLFQPLGFIVTTLLFLFAVMLRLGVRPIQAVVYSVMYVVVIYLMFTVLFSIPLPAGVLSVIGM